MATTTKVDREVLSTILRAPRYACSLGGALTSILAINRGIPIVHASPGCSWNLWLGQVKASGYQGAGYAGGACQITTKLQAKQIIHGGEDKLRQQIKASIDWVEGDFIAVLTGCSADLVGDDIKAIANEYNSKDKPVLYFTTGGFRGNSFRGYEIILEGMANQVMEKPARKEKGLVNVFGIVPYQDMFWRGDLVEVRRVLEKIGVKANMMFGRPRFGLESWQRAPQAELNLMLSPWLGLEFLKKFEDRFGVPYLALPQLPVGPTETTRMLRMVGERLGRRKSLIEKAIAEEEKETYCYVDDMADLYIDWGWQFTFGVIGDSNLAMGVTKFLSNDMGYVPLFVIITDDPPDKHRAAIINELHSLDYDQKPEVIFETNADSIWEIMAKSDAEIFLGSSLDGPLARKLTAAHVSISRPAVDRLITNNAICGYKGGLELVADINTAVMQSNL